MQNAFFIVGPTASGKTALAVDLAERCGAEIVSADAYQVYRGLHLLTAKPTPEQQRRVPHHLINCVDLSENYNVARYLEDARRCIDEISRRGRLVFVVGGNGLYVKALTHGLSPLPEAQPELRAELDASAITDLQARLTALDPVTAASIDVRNKRRLVRALEVCLVTGKPFSSFRAEWQRAPASPHPHGVFFRRDRAELAVRIDQRVQEMFDQGVVNEVRFIASDELSSTARQIIGLAEIQSLVARTLDTAACGERIKIATRQYAKRQDTWFKRETLFEPIHLSAASDAAGQSEELHSRFLSWLGNRHSGTKVSKRSAHHTTENA